MRDYQNGDPAAFEIIYERHKTRVFGFLLKRLRNHFEAEEVFQGTFMKLHNSRKLYDPSFRFAPWLFTISQSVLKDHLRKKNRVLEESDSEGVDQAPAKENVSLMPPLESLDERQRMALELRYGQESSFEEIAEKLKTSPSNVRQLISRAIKKLRKEPKEGL